MGVTKNLTGLSERQIRYYEKANLVQPARTAGKQRLYSPADVEQLLRIKVLLAEGYSLEEVRQLLSAPPYQDVNWMALLRSPGWQRQNRHQRALRLRDLAPLRVLAQYRRQHPPAIDRLYRGGTASAAILHQGSRLFPLYGPQIVNFGWVPKEQPR